jgi:hypothetical protein
MDMSAAARDPYRLSSPHVFLLRMVVFLILAGFVALILYRQIATAFMANPGLNGLILGVLAIGIVLTLRQVLLLIPEVRWANALGREPGERRGRRPVLLAPAAALLGGEDFGGTLTTTMLRAILDSVATRLDEARDVARYLTGLLIFLGLLGTFWGLLETVGSIGTVIRSMQTGADAAVMFDDLKNGLSAPIAGMSISFTSSLFGLAGSLILGFLDLQAGQAQNRFFRELEDKLSARIEEQTPNPYVALPIELRNAFDQFTAAVKDTRGSAVALTELAEGIRALVTHMHKEHEDIRHWFESQSQQQAEIQKLLGQLMVERGHR